VPLLTTRLTHPPTPAWTSTVPIPSASSKIVWTMPSMAARSDIDSRLDVATCADPPDSLTTRPAESMSSVTSVAGFIMYSSPPSIPGPSSSGAPIANWSPLIATEVPNWSPASLSKGTMRARTLQVVPLRVNQAARPDCWPTAPLNGAPISAWSSSTQTLSPNWSLSPASGKTSFASCDHVAPARVKTYAEPELHSGFPGQASSSRGEPIRSVSSCRETRLPKRCPGAGSDATRICVSLQPAPAESKT
jgi:hypothetical protein